MANNEQSHQLFEPKAVISETEADEALVQQCLGGNQRAFGKLVERYEKKLYNVSFRVTNDSEEAMDATQTAFVKAYQKLHTFDPSYRFFSWIYRILLNESLTLVNKRKRFEPLETDVVLKGKGPEENYSDAETSWRVGEAIMELKMDYRIVIVLKHFHDMSYKEMSDITGVPEKTVKSRLFTARQQLKEILSSKGISG